MSAELSAELAIQLRDLLETTAQRLVLAESCTAGRVAATLASLPGISQWLCGSFVVYRSQSKIEWLGISPAVLDDPAIGPVSATTTLLLAQAALARTSEADVALAITGDIGPGAPPEKDGKVFCAIANRHGAAREAALQLIAPTPAASDDIAARNDRLNEATHRVLQFAIETLQAPCRSQEKVPDTYCPTDP